MLAFKAYKLGLRRISQARRYILIVYLLNLAIAMALGLVLSADIQDSLGNSLAAERLRNGFDDLWFQGFSGEAQGISKTFHPAVTGIGAIFEGLDAIVTGNFGRLQGTLGIALIYGALWIYLSAGFIGMFYNGSFDGIFGQHFFAEAGRHFMRFLMLTGIAVLLYWLILGALLPVLNDFVANRHRDTILEPLVFRDTVIKYSVIWLLILLINHVFDYAKILVVAHDVRKKDIWRVPLYAVYFMVKHPVKIFTLFLMLGLTWLVLLLIYWLVAPGAWQASWFTVLFAFLLGQIYMVSRVAVRCLIFGSEIALYYYQAVLPSTEARQLPEKATG